MTESNISSLILAASIVSVVFVLGCWFAAYWVLECFRVAVNDRVERLFRQITSQQESDRQELLRHGDKLKKILDAVQDKEEPQ